MLSAKKTIVFFLGLLISRSANAEGLAINNDGLKTFAAIDLVGNLGIENPPGDSGRLRIRGFEFAVFGPVDPLFDATLNLAGHDENGVTKIELHEAYVASSRLLLDGLRARFGQFFLGVGRLNRFHSHDWPFTSPPKSHRTFFDEEAVIDTGAEIEKTFDIGSALWTMDVLVGATNGWNYGHSHTAGRRPLMGTHYIRTSFFHDLQGGRGLVIGLNYLGRTDADSVQTRLAGLDMVFKNRIGKVLKNSFQMEAYHRLQSSKYFSATEEVGGYVNYAAAITETGDWSVGGRFDAFSTLSLTFANAERRPNFDYGLVPHITYQATEFSKLRGSYGVQVETRQGDAARIEQRVELQLVVVFGAHPAHDF